MDISPQMIQEFRIAEYNALRSEIIYQIQEIDKIKFWVAAAMAGYYSFIAAKFLIVKNNKVTLIGPVWAWLVPAFLPVLGILRLHANIGQLAIFAAYIKQIEGLYPGLSGWEHFYGQHRAEDTVWNNDLAYFIILLAISLGIFGFRWLRRK